MDSSEATVPGLEAPAVGASSERALTQRATSVPGDWIALAVALVAATVPTFYKEWLFALALGFAGLIAKPAASAHAPHERPNPIVLAAIATIAVLLLQAIAFDGVWR